MITAALTIGSVSLVPAYLSSGAQLNEVRQYLEIQQEAREVAKQDTAVQTARMVNTQIAQLLETEHTGVIKAIEYVMRDWDIHAQDIIISGFDYNLGEDNTSQLRISGEARDRGSLNGFVQTLRANPEFVRVSFPVSDLAEGELVNFSVNIQFES
jgi:hypothetical protein